MEEIWDVDITDLFTLSKDHELHNVVIKFVKN